MGAEDVLEPLLHQGGDPSRFLGRAPPVEHAGGPGTGGEFLHDLPQVGHSLAASAALEAALTVQGMNEGIVLPTLHLDVDPEFEGLDFVPGVARRHPHDVALSNSFGFGGPNSCIVFKRWEP